MRVRILDFAKKHLVYYLLDGGTVEIHAVRPGFAAGSERLEGGPLIDRYAAGEFSASQSGTGCVELRVPNTHRPL